MVWNDLIWLGFFAFHSVISRSVLGINRVVRLKFRTPWGFPVDMEAAGMVGEDSW